MNANWKEPVPMRKGLFVLGFVAMTVCGLPSGADAEAALPCGSRTTMAATLERNYKEMPVSVGRANDGNVVEVYLSATGSWTIVITNPAGKSCLIAAGEAWQPLPPVFPKDASG